MLVDESYMNNILSLIKNNRYLIYNYHFYLTTSTSVDFRGSTYTGAFAFDVVIPGSQMESKVDILDRFSDSIIPLSGCFGNGDRPAWFPIYADVHTEEPTPFIRLYIQSLRYFDTDTYTVDFPIENLTLRTWEV